MVCEWFVHVPKHPPGLWVHYPFQIAISLAVHDRADLEERLRRLGELPEVQQRPVPSGGPGSGLGRLAGGVAPMSDVQ
jgi:hypothetical protein